MTTSVILRKHGETTQACVSRLPEFGKLQASLTRRCRRVRVERMAAFGRSKVLVERPTSGASGPFCYGSTGLISMLQGTGFLRCNAFLSQAAIASSFSLRMRDARASSLQRLGSATCNSRTPAPHISRDSMLAARFSGHSQSSGVALMIADGTVHPAKKATIPAMPTPMATHLF